MKRVTSHYIPPWTYTEQAIKRNICKVGAIKIMYECKKALEISGGPLLKFSHLFFIAPEACSVKKGTFWKVPRI